jgi:hypothetical protein
MAAMSRSYRTRHGYIYGCTSYLQRGAAICRNHQLLPMQQVDCVLTDDAPTKARGILRALLAARIVMTSDHETGECRRAGRANPRDVFEGLLQPIENGAEDWNRTSDTSIFSAVLYQLSYLGTADQSLAEPQSYQRRLRPRLQPRQ